MCVKSEGEEQSPRGCSLGGKAQGNVCVWQGEGSVAINLER